MIYWAQEVNAERDSALQPQPHPQRQRQRQMCSSRSVQLIAHEMQLIITNGFVRSSSDNSS